MTTSTQNPFIKAFETKTFHTPDEAVPFDKIKTEHYQPALDYAITEAKKNVQKIKDSAEAPNFKNVIEALETSSELLDQVSGIYFNLFSAEANEEHQALAKEISPKLAAYSSDITLDKTLFTKIKSVFENQENENLDQEQKMLLENYFKNFSRNGALLNDQNKTKLRQIDQELSTLSPQFSENVLKATNKFEMIIKDKADLSGLPESAIEAAAHEAEAKEHTGKWLFNLQGPSFLPFMMYANNRELRKKLWTAFSSKAFGDDFDNQENILNIVRLKSERAKLLGFKNHAEFVLAERMAKNEQTVFQFLEKLLVPAKKAADKDLSELKQFRKELEGQSEIMPWDIAYYSEKLKEKKYSFNEEELRPYFKLENVVAGVFEHARKLYGLEFQQVTDVPLYHPDVKVFRVTEAATQKYIGLFYTDFFPRATKKPGAWMTNIRDQGLQQGQIKRPHVSIVCNFTKPTPQKPSLITYDEVHTLFHEFGHALHGLLSECKYRSLSGANVYWDFVELPSQIMENWVKEKESLDLFAKHYETNQPIPAELIEKVKRANLFQSGWFCLRQLQFGFLDMYWHSTPTDQIRNVDEFESNSVSKTRILPKIEGTNGSCSFSHIFAGGYSAGYYSYKWAEVLDADAFEYFKEKGLFNQEVASKFKNFVLSKGGTEHPMELYKKFRGREPDPNALLKRDGLLDI